MDYRLWFESDWQYCFILFYIFIITKKYKAFYIFIITWSLYLFIIHVCFMLRLPAASREPSLCSWPLGPASAPEKRFAFREPRRQRQRVATRGSRRDQAMQQLHPILAQTECEEAARPWNLPDFLWKQWENRDLKHRTDPGPIWGVSFCIGVIHILKQNYIFVLQTSLWLSCGYRWRRQSCHKMFTDPKISQRFGTFWNFGLAK